MIVSKLTPDNNMIWLVRGVLATALAVAALAVLSSAAAGSPERRTECEAVTGGAGPDWVCVGTIPSSRARVVLKSRNGSSERGIARVTFGIHLTRVVIRLTGAPPGVRQPAQIRRGGCRGRTLTRLGSVVDGRSLAKVRPLAHLSGLAITVHASTERGAVVVACGIIPRHHRSP